MIALYHQTKIPISFWCTRGLNSKSLIQPSETLPVKLTRIHYHKTVLRITQCGTVWCGAVHYHLQGGVVQLFHFVNSFGQFGCDHTIQAVW